jgi:hypothetical protein
MPFEPPLRSLKVRCLLALLSCAASLPAGAQTSSATSTAAIAAESAFLEGVRLMKQGDWPEAAQRFAESERLDPASGTLLNLAYCRTQLGKTASAWLTYRQAIALAERTGKPAHAQLAREQGEKLETALPKLRFALVGEAGRVTRLRLDDEEMAQDSWSLSVPVDPGQHRIVAVFDSGESWETVVLAQPGQQSVVEVKVPQTAAPAAPAVAQAPSAPPAVTEPPAPVSSSKSTPEAAAARPSGWALGLGLAGAGAVVGGSALFASARLSYDAARKHCSAENVCESPFYDREQSADSRAKLSFVLAGSGALLLGVAAVLYFRPSHGDKPQAQLSALVLGPHDFAAAVTRAF